jgi:predicted nucleic acid-binding protein
VREKVVVDSACLIALEQIGHLEVLSALFDPVMIPPAVEQEFGIPLPWLTVKKLDDDSLATILKLSVDDGEAEAIALAHEQSCLIILDDEKARFAGKEKGLNVIGTIGVLIRAKQEGIYPAFKPLLEALEQTGFYISQALKEEALRIAKE